MTTDEAMSAYTQLSAVLVRLSEGHCVTLNKTDAEWLARLHLLLPEFPLPETVYTVVAVPVSEPVKGGKVIVEISQ